MNHHRAATTTPQPTMTFGLAVALILALLLGACSSSPVAATTASTPASIAASITVAPTALPATTPPTPVPPPPAPTRAPNPLAELVQPLAPAALVSELKQPKPPTRSVVALSIPAIGVTSAPVVPVGVNADDLSFEVPPASDVGWYEHGPQPGALTGSAVLAAHIAFNGEDGVFRHLDDVEAGDRILVTWSDGTTDTFTAGATETYDKSALPDSLWAEDGDPQLVLITCGGAFNRSRSSYESNVVVVAT